MRANKLKIVVIANPAACGGKAIETYNRYADFLTIEMIPYIAYLTKGFNDEIPIKTLIEEERPEIISVIGGDGTLNITLNSLPDLNIYLHLIPAGTGNDFSKLVYEVLNERAIFQLVRGNYRLKQIDSWKCNKKRFINCFGAGFDGEIAKRMFNKTYFLPPKLKYYAEILKSIFTYKSTLLIINGKQQPCFMLAVANGSVYGGGFKIAPKADPTDSLVDLIIIGKVPVFMRFFYLPIIECGKHLNLDIITYSQNSIVTITSLTPLPAQIDGEPMLASSYNVTLEGKVSFLIAN